ncbi:MAG: hypothetical protein ABIE22_03005 [archaeon]
MVEQAPKWILPVAILSAVVFTYFASHWGGNKSKDHEEAEEVLRTPNPIVEEAENPKEVLLRGYESQGWFPLSSVRTLGWKPDRVYVVDETGGRDTPKGIAPELSVVDLYKEAGFPSDLATRGLVYNKFILNDNYDYCGGDWQNQELWEYTTNHPGEVKAFLIEQGRLEDKVEN